MAYRDFNYLQRRTVLDKLLSKKAFEIATNSKHDGYKRGLASMVYKLFNQKWKRNGADTAIKTKGNGADTAIKIKTKPNNNDLMN